MSWKAMTPVEACDLMDIWDAEPWPLTRDQVQQRAVEWFGWTIEIDNGVSYLMNTVSGFTIPDVSTIGSRRNLSYLGLNFADTIREVTRESRGFLGDAYTLIVREGESRWGTPALSDREGTSSAVWDTASGARISFTLALKGLRGRFETPQGVELDRKAGRR
ncbi:DUF6301 family protein [Lentzea sp. JNUCC 0626]|uniref:DUF6301 family protein n=1 Tax=Lentzea sp. JNUCC 0626 TaxID=3367513 RepID=UPI0037487E37